MLAKGDFHLRLYLRSIASNENWIPYCLILILAEVEIEAGTSLCWPFKNSEMENHIFWEFWFFLKFLENFKIIGKIWILKKWKKCLVWNYWHFLKRWKYFENCFFFILGKLWKFLNILKLFETHSRQLIQIVQNIWLSNAKWHFFL